MKKDKQSLSPEARAIIRAQLTRRTLFAGVGAVSAAGLLAACGTGSSTGAEAVIDVSDSEKSKKEWWDKNYQKLIDLDIPYEDWKIIIKHKSDFDGVYNSTAKHRALYLLNTYSIEELENLINDYSFDDEF